MASTMEKQLQAIGIGLVVIILLSLASLFVGVPWVIIILVTIVTYLGVVYYAIRKLGLEKREIHQVTKGIAASNVIVNFVVLVILAPDYVLSQFTTLIASAIFSIFIIAWLFAYIGIALFKTKEIEVKIVRPRTNNSLWAKVTAGINNFFYNTDE